jgi:hypothetical protein
MQLSNNNVASKGVTVSKSGFSEDKLGYLKE